MRREHFTLQSPNVAADPPTFVVTYDGPVSELTDRLEGGDLSGGDTDAAFRLQDPVEADNATGVFSLTRRLTGEYLLEANTGSSGILGLVDAAREEDGSYRIRLEHRGDDDLVLDKETLLVYDASGNLLRHHSLIPGGVEL